MKKITAVLLFLLLAACGKDTEAETKPKKELVSNKVRTTGSGSLFRGERFHHVEVETPNGVVDCIFVETYKEGTISCNWEKFNKLQ